MIAVLVVVWGCARNPDYQIGGARFLAEGADPSVAMVEVLKYPVTDYEIEYLNSSLAAIEVAAAAKPELWEALQTESDPMEAARPNAIWKASGVNGEDVIAVTMKLTLLREYGDLDESRASIEQNLSWLEERLEKATDPKDREELKDAIKGTRAILELARVLESSGSLARYQAERSKFDTALDRFLSIGEK